MSQFPLVKIGSLCEIRTGKKDVNEGNVNGAYPFFTCAESHTYSDSYSFECEALLVAGNGNVGQVTYYNGKFEAYQRTYVLSGFKDVSPQFLFFILDGLLKDSLSDKKLGNTIPYIKKGMLSDFLVALPSLQMQDKIVEKLSDLFNKINAATEATKKNLDNVKRLYELYISNIYESAKAYSEFNECEFGSIIDILTDYHANGSYETLKKHVEIKSEKDYAWLVRSTDFENNFHNDFRYISQEAYEFMAKSKVYGGELIVSKIGNAGKVYLMPEISTPCSLAMNLFLVRLKKNIANSMYVYYFLKSYAGEKQITSRLKGMATQTITKDNLRSILIPLVNLDIQVSIAKKVEKLELLIIQLETEYQKKILELQKLKIAVLKQAMCGELTKV